MQHCQKHRGRAALSFKVVTLEGKGGKASLLLYNVVTRAIYWGANLRDYSEVQRDLKHCNLYKNAAITGVQESAGKGQGS
jgi:hypothetical protein